MKTKLHWLEILLLLAPLLVLAIYWNDLPARVPTHWNLHGEIDRWDAKWPGLFIAPLTALGTIVLLRFLPWFDPRLRKNPSEHGRMSTTLPVIRFALLVLFDAIFAVQIAVSLGAPVPGGRMVTICALLFMAVMGNYLGNVRPNYFVGIRTPWTLENPETWRATHRLGGRLICYGSLLLLVIQFFLNESVFGWLFLGAISLLAVWVILYPWHHSRTHAAPH